MKSPTILTIATERKADKTIVKASGPLTETADLPGIDIGSSKRLAFDLRSINYMNSAGVLIWLKWITALRETYSSVPFEFHNCPSFFVNNINCIRGFIPQNSTVLSMYAPYYCENCNETKNELLTRGQNYQIEGQPNTENKFPFVHCSLCNGPMVLDVIPEQYFSFLGAAKLSS